MLIGSIADNIKAFIIRELAHIIDFYSSSNVDHRFCLATIVSVEGSSYRRIGARMLVRNDGQWRGGISGGCLEGHALKIAQRVIFSNKATLVVYDTTQDDPFQIGVGLGCQGVVKVLFSACKLGDTLMALLHNYRQRREPTVLIQVVDSEDNDRLGKLIDVHDELYTEVQDKISNLMKSKPFKCTNGETILAEIIPPILRLRIVGQHHDITYLMDCAVSLGWQCELFAPLHKLTLVLPSKDILLYETHALAQHPVDAHTALVLMTHDLKTDIQVLQEIDVSAYTYIGVMGPQNRFEKITEACPFLKDNDQVYAPIGLDIGAMYPEEIAHSIVAEIIAVFRDRAGTSLRNRQGPIYS